MVRLMGHAHDSDPRLNEFQVRINWNGLRMPPGGVGRRSRLDRATGPIRPKGRTRMRLKGQQSNTPLILVGLVILIVVVAVAYLAFLTPR